MEDPFEPLLINRSTLSGPQLRDVKELDAAQAFAAALAYLQNDALAQANWELLSSVLDRLAQLVPIDAPGHVVNGTDAFQVPLMHQACACGFVPAVEKLIALGSDIKAKHRPCDRTLLHLTDDPDLIRLLVRLGLEVDARDEYGLTPLHLRALESTYLPRREKHGWSTLVELGADVNARTDWRETPLRIACGSRSVGIVRAD